MNKCLCQSFEFGHTTDIAETGDVDFEGYTTECTQSTTRIFAQGHDAKLVGFLVRAELGGEEIHMLQGGVNHVFGSAVNAAGTVSAALAAKAQAQLDAARARIAKKELAEATKKARRSERKAAKVEAAPTTRDAKIKVGRWEYDATIDLATGAATYTSKQGVTWTKAQGDYQEV